MAKPVLMKRCMQCGSVLTDKYLASEDRRIPFCPSCGEFRFPVFNTAVSMICTNEARDRILLIRQYGGRECILVAGYVNQGEDAEDAAVREVREELGMDALSVRFNRSHFFVPSNTLMLNFTVVLPDTDAAPNAEIDSWHWYSIDEARASIRRGSLAEAFLLGYLDHRYLFRK